MEIEKKLRSGRDPLLFEQLQAEQCVLVPPGLRFFGADILITTKEENLRAKGIGFVKAKKKHANGRARGVALMSDVMQFLCHTIFEFFNRLLVFTMLKKLLNQTNLEKNFSSLCEEVFSKR